MSFEFEFNEDGMAEIERQVGSRIRAALNEVSLADWGNGHPELVLEHLKEALRAVGTEPNEEGLTEGAALIAGGEGPAQEIFTP